MNNKLNIVDMFCGGGGESTGLISAAHDFGFDINMSAINHWERAIETHAANYPFAEHRVEDVQTINPETLNAQIKTTKLGFIANGIFSFDLILDIQGGGGVCVGDWVLKGSYGINVIKRILEVVGVDTWEKLEGKYIRIKDIHLDDRVTSIGNLMKEEWITFDTLDKEGDKND